MAATLRITHARRIIGTVMVLGMYGVAIVASARSHTYDHFAAIYSPLLPANAPLISLITSSCASILCPFILYPCLFNRFPKWMWKHFTESQLEAMAKSYFGSSLIHEQRSQ